MLPSTLETSGVLESTERQVESPVWRQSSIACLALDLPGNLEAMIFGDPLVRETDCGPNDRQLGADEQIRLARYAFSSL